MKKKLISLIDLKSVITLLLVTSLIAIVFTGVNINDEAIKALFISTTSSCFTYYFAKKETREQHRREDESEVMTA